MKKVLTFLKKRWLLVAIVLLVVGVLGYNMTAGKPKDANEVSYRVKRQTLREVLTFSGSVDAGEKATLRFQTSGRLTWLGVKEGDTVRKYQAVASLDQQSLKKQLQKELIVYEKERMSHDNSTLDYDNHALPADQYARQDAIDAYKKSQYDLDSSVLDVELSDISLRYATLISPINGLVLSMGTKQAGVNITPAQAEIVVADPTTIYFSGAVDQTDVVKLKEGMEGEVTYDAYPEEKVMSSVQSIAFTPKTDETGTVYEVKASMPVEATSSSALKYRLGMTGDIEFVTKQLTDVLGVPTTFIHREGGKDYVFTKKNNQKVKTPVRLGEEIDTATVILDGLNEGDIVYD